MTKKASREKGICSIELITGILALVPIVLLTVDISSILLGSSLAGLACRDAARCASSGRPAFLAAGQHTVPANSSPYLRAKAALSNYHTNNTVTLRLTKLTENIENPVPTQPLGGAVKGQVRVELSAIVSPPFTLAMLPQTVNLPVQRTFPYTKILPTIF